MFPLIFFGFGIQDDEETNGPPERPASDSYEMKLAELSHDTELSQVRTDYNEVLMQMQKLEEIHEQDKARCAVFNIHGGCWKASRCKFKHTKEPPPPGVKLGPWVDVRTDDAGNQKIAPRLSMTQCIKKVFSEQGTVVCIMRAGRQVGMLHAHLRLDLAFSGVWGKCKSCGSDDCA